MRVNLKALGLALAAVLVMSAVAASAAQAEISDFTADKYPVVVKGEQEGDENYLEATPEEQLTCGVAEYQATLTQAVTTLTVTPHYAECKKNGETAVSVALNGCHYLFHTHGTTVEGDTPGTADVVCPEEKEITVSGPFGICVDHIPPQAGLGGTSGEVTFTNVPATGHVTVDVDITDTVHVKHTDTAFCPWTASETIEDGNFVSTVTMKGFEDETEGLITGPTGAETTYHANEEKPVNIDVGEVE
jgi:hypothetical protein